MPKTLEEVLSLIILVGSRIELAVWTDTKNDKPITTTIIIEFPQYIDEMVCKEIIRRINQYIPIFTICIGKSLKSHWKVGTYYEIMGMKEYMKKTCEGC